MSKKSSSNISIKQLLEVSLLIIVTLLGSIEIYKNEQISIEVGSKVANQEYEEAIVENSEEDYIQHEDIKYLDRKEIISVVSRGGNVIRTKKEEINDKKQEIVVSEENKEKVEESTKNTEKIIINREENSVQEEPPVEYKKVIEAKATAYCLCKKCCGKSETHPEYGVTASGLKIIPGTGMKVIAVDPNVIPLGTKVYIEGLNGAKDYGYAIAADTGSAIKDLKIDLYMETHEKAYQWGRKQVKIYVIE